MDLTINGVVRYTPSAKQREFHACAARFVLYGGAAGGGKSHALRWHGYMCCLQVPNFRVLLLRRGIPDLKRTHLKVVPGEVESWGIGAYYMASEMIVKFPNNSSFEFGHCQDDQAVAIYLSAEYDLILFDELVTFTEYQYKMVSSRCRTVIPGVMPRVLAGTNPGGPESYWVRRYWVDRDVEPDEDPTYNPDDYAYIPATLDDNPYINQEEYERMLMRLPPDLARAYRHGDWDIYQGQFFPEFRKALHVMELPPQPPHLKRFCGMDWGYASEGVVLWGVILPDGQLYVEDELVFNGPRAKTLRVAHEVALMVKERREARQLTAQVIYADPSIFKHSGHTGETIAETFARHGVGLVPANNDRIMGWAKLRAWLRPMPPHPDLPVRPWMWVHPRCSYLIRTIPQLIMDGTNPEDLDTTGPDHACFSADTLVATQRGQVPIADVTRADEVMTRDGFKRVICAGQTKASADVYDVWFSDGMRLRATADHSVRIITSGSGRFAPSEWVRVDALRYGNIAVCLRASQAATIPTITAPPEPVGDRCSGPFLPSTTSTTKTATPQTMRQTTWRVCQRAIISASTVGLSRVGRFLSRHASRLPRGIDRLKGAIGIARMPFGCGNSDSPWCDAVAYAGVSSPTTVGMRSSAPTTVSRTPVGGVGWMMCSAGVSTVSAPFPLGNTRARVSAPDAAPSVIAVLPAGREPVYNLSVDPSGLWTEFYANGVLVKNCDALRYMIAGRPSPTRDVIVEPDYPVGSVGWLKKSVMGRSTPPLLGARNVRRNARF